MGKVMKAIMPHDQHAKTSGPQSPRGGAGAASPRSNVSKVTNSKDSSDLHQHDVAVSNTSSSPHGKGQVVPVISTKSGDEGDSKAIAEQRQVEKL